jgi:hypothetical protein
MIMNSVESNNIAKIGYDAPTQILQIQFKRKNLEVALNEAEPEYQYLCVPQHIYDELMASPSKGSFFASKIKGIFECKKVENKP